MKECDHTWYMREKGITCTKCLVIWESDERAEDSTDGLAQPGLLACLERWQKDLGS